MRRNNVNLQFIFWLEYVSTSVTLEFILPSLSARPRAKAVQLINVFLQSPLDLYMVPHLSHFGMWFYNVIIQLIFRLEYVSTSVTL